MICSSVPSGDLGIFVLLEEIGRQSTFISSYLLLLGYYQPLTGASSFYLPCPNSLYPGAVSCFASKSSRLKLENFN